MISAPAVKLENLNLTGEVGVTLISQVNNGGEVADNLTITHCDLNVASGSTNYAVQLGTGRQGGLAFTNNVVTGTCANYAVYLDIQSSTSHVLTRNIFQCTFTNGIFWYQNYDSEHAQPDAKNNYWNFTNSKVFEGFVGFDATSESFTNYLPHYAKLIEDGKLDENSLVSGFTYYVSMGDNDENNGLSTEKAFKTI